MSGVRGLIAPLRSFVGRVATRVVDGSGVSPSGLKGGTGSAAQDLRPIVALVLTGWTASQVTDLMALVGPELSEPGAGRPLFVLDQPHFAAVRQAGFAVEHLIPEQEWVNRGTYSRRAMTWQEYRRTRMEQLQRDYALAAVRELSAGADAGQVRQALAVPALGALALVRARSIRAVERLLP